MIDFDCMTPQELTLWQTPTHTSNSRAKYPCVDCPIWFHEQERAAGRCERIPRKSGRPRVYANDEERRLARNERERGRARERAQRRAAARRG